MEKLNEESEHFPEVKDAIIKLLESNGRQSNYIALQKLLPDVNGREFRVSMSSLLIGGEIKTGHLEEIEVTSQCDKRMILGKPAFSVIIILI